MDYLGLVHMNIELIILESLLIMLRKIMINNHRLKKSINGFGGVVELLFSRVLNMRVVILGLVLIKLGSINHCRLKVRRTGENLKDFIIVKIIK
jgi:hypothetical protein